MARNDCSCNSPPAQEGLTFAMSQEQMLSFSFTSYVAQQECAPHLQFPLFHPAPTGLEQLMPYPPMPTGAPRSPPSSFTLSDEDPPFSSDEELDPPEPELKKHKAAKLDVPKRVQFHPFMTVMHLVYTEVPGSKGWKRVPIRQRADEDGILYPRHWAKVKFIKMIRKRSMRSYVEQGCKCKKDDEEKDCVCFYCSRVHTRVMMKNHQRDEDDLGMKLDITSCSALCCALDLRGMPPASPMHGRKGFERFFS